MRIALKQSYIQISATILLIVLFLISLMTFWYQSKINTELLIADDVAILSSIFKKINETCGITGFKYQKNNYIDYLQVISFAGSEIGTMKLRHPQKWHGPYVRDNPMIQGKFYQIVATKKGYFIVPGDGVRLKNGALIGHDIVFDYTADIPAMAENPELLQFQGKPLAAYLEIAHITPTIPLEEITAED